MSDAKVLAFQGTKTQDAKPGTRDTGYRAPETGHRTLGTPGLRVLHHPLGSGIGGKAAGLQTLSELSGRGLFEDILKEMSAESRFRDADEEIKPFIPATAVLASGHFKSYTQDGIVAPAIAGGNPDEIACAMRNTGITDYETITAVSCMLENLEGPVAVRSSASCEDRSRRSPFAGDFATTFVVCEPGAPAEKRLELLLGAIREVYASFFSTGVAQKMHSLGLKPEEHYMSVVLQRVVGEQRKLDTEHGTRNLHFPFASAVLTSRSIGIERPEGVSRDSPFMRLGFGMGTLVVGSGERETVPCTIIFPDRPGIMRTPTSLTFADSRGDFATAQVREFLATQDVFDAIDTDSGALTRLGFGEIRDIGFTARFSDALAAFRKDWSIAYGSALKTANIGHEDDIRATFPGFIRGPAGIKAIEFLGRVARRLKSECGFDVDIELAITQEKDSLGIGFLQLRPFGSVGGSLAMSQVPQERLIASTHDCIGHGKAELGHVVIVTPEAGADVRASQSAIGQVDVEFGGDYLLIGPNITREIGKGGAYAQAFNPGAVISYGEEGVSMISPGTHMFNNIAMMRVIETGKEQAMGKIGEMLKNGKEIVKGVFMAKKDVVVELDGETGLGQAFLREDE